MRLRSKFAFAVIALVVVVLGSSSAFLFWAENKHLVRQWEVRKLDALQKFASVCLETTINQNDVIAINYLKVLSQSPEIAYAVFTSTEGEVLVHSDMQNVGMRLNDETTRWTLETPDVLTQNYRLPDGTAINDLALPVTQGSRKVGVCRVGYSVNRINLSIRDSLRGMIRRTLVVLLAALVLGVIGAFVLAQTLTRPIALLERAAGEIGEGKLEHRVVVNRRDELGSLAARFNEMAAALSKLDKMKNDFVASVSHELRSPLTAIKCYVDVVLRGRAGDISAKTKEYLEVAMRNTNRLAHFINDILDLAKMEAGMTQINALPTEANKLMEDVVQLFQMRAQESKIHLAISVDKQLRPLNIDPDRVRQVVTNLVSNALNFTPEEGSITLSAQMAENGFAQCSVADTGAGISPEALPRIFNKFEQGGNQSMARQIKGTGLGLTIAKAIVEAHGGHIWVESKIGRGTTFRFTVPLVKPSNA